MYEAFKKSTKAEPYLQNCLAVDRQNHDQHAAGPRRQYAVVYGEDRTEYPRERL
jgi:hypothetical protein